MTSQRVEGVAEGMTRERFQSWIQAGSWSFPLDRVHCHWAPPPVPAVFPGVQAGVQH